MRLEKIKLAGFKSFVDPTTIEFPSALTGVIGPNGCGKSNVIDAVKWVMGESSAKQLRGESITDVIFNGTVDRKPVNQATVELIFDNKEGRIGGEYAKFAEISIKRVVTREAQSTYYLNGTKCRRRDIIDVFLGTGLGPRSYSIIEQGMISHLIEAKPEELRRHIEEVSGISKYKERRRETENRIKHTKENLLRLSDIRIEIEKTLTTLDRQAKSAERYKILKAEERVLRAQKQAVHWQQLDISVSKSDEIQQTLQVEVEKHLAAQQHNETEATKLRELLHDLNERHGDVQGRYYRLGSDITRIESAINHYKERQSQLSDDFSETERAYQSAQQHLASDQARYSEQNQQLEILQPQHDQAKETSEEASQQLSAAQDSMHQWQQEWDEFNSDSQQSSETAQVEQTRIQHLEDGQFNAKRRMDAIVEEGKQLDVSKPQEEYQQLQQQLAIAEQMTEQHQSQLEQLQDDLKEHRQTQLDLTQQLDEQKNKLQQGRGRCASLEALQQEALGKQGHESAKWLESQGLSDKKRLAETIKVNSGWEQAAETVLGTYLEAVCVDDMSQLAGELTNFKGNLTLFDTQHAANARSNQNFKSLSTQVQGAESLLALLETVYIAEDLPQALSMRDQLAAHESVVSKEGIWLGKSWLRVAKQEDSRSGVLYREQELKALKQRIETLEANIAQSQHKFGINHERLLELEQLRDNKQYELSEHRSSTSDMGAKVSVKKARIDQVKHRIEQLNAEAEGLRGEIDKSANELQGARSTWQTAMHQMEQDVQQREAMLAKRDQTREALNQAQDRSQQARDQLHQVELQLNAAQAEVTSLNANIERTGEQSEHLKTRYEQLKEALSHGDSPLEGMQTDLNKALDDRSVVEKELTEVKVSLSNKEDQQRQYEDMRSNIENQVQSVRENLQTQKMASQENRVRCRTIEEQLTGEGFDVKQVLDELPEELDESVISETLERTETRIQRLGAINLAAIDEFKTQSERKEYLDAQDQDLTEALETLEDAIKQIDTETRERFKETYDIVNDHFQKYFPKIFGGGQAYLELTGEDLLNTGISVIARPPGKKNSTIHLLSGGEKALTAIALIFSLFQVNPAPFCMLDEVDAPLDDVNVARYCRVVEEMSSEVQFIFISHNKVAMEMANHLMGVTMHEPGVSRIVSVDMEEAVALAEA